MKNLIILISLFFLMISCKSGDDYLGNWFDKKNNTYLYISKAGEKGYLIRLTNREYELDKTSFYIFDDGYFYLYEDDKNKESFKFIIQNEETILSVNGFVFKKS